MNFIMTNCLEFTKDELSLFERRYENGYDLKDDNRYNLWLREKAANPASNGEMHAVFMVASACKFSVLKSSRMKIRII